MSLELNANLNKIAQRLSNREFDFNLQMDIAIAESKLFDISHMRGCLLLSKLSLMHLVELGIADAQTPDIRRKLSDFYVSSSHAFALLIEELAAEFGGKAVE